MEGIILTSWDHIMGPQILKLWFMKDQLNEVSANILQDFNISKCNENNSEVPNLSDMNIYSVMCGQLLLSEVDSEKLEREWVSRFYMSEFKIIIAVVYHLTTWANNGKSMKDACFCLGIVFEHEKLEFALNNHSVIDKHLRKAVNIIQDITIPSSKMWSELNNLLCAFPSLLNLIDEKCSNSFQLSSFEDHVKSDLISKAMVSHMQTSGNSIVIGSSEFILNQVIHTLSIFTHSVQNNTLRCTNKLQNILESSIHGIYTRGFLKDSNNESEYLLEKACKESVYLTVIDVDLNYVWQSKYLENVNNSSRDHSVLVTDDGTLIPNFLNDLAFVKQNKGNHDYFVQEFINFLWSKSVLLIKVIDQYRHIGEVLKESDVMAILAVHDLVDLHILIGFAETFKPGFRNLCKKYFNKC